MSEGGLIGVLVVDDGLGDGLPDDAHIEPEAPMLHVPDVVVDAAFHLP